MRTLHTALLALALVSTLLLSGTALAFGPAPPEDEAEPTSEQQADQERRERLKQQTSEQSSKQSQKRRPVIGNIIIHDQDGQGGGQDSQ